MADQPKSNMMKRFLSGMALRIVKLKPVTWVVGGLVLALVGGASGISFVVMKPDPEAQVAEARELLDGGNVRQALENAAQFLNANRGGGPLTSDAAFIYGKALYQEAGTKADVATEKANKLVASRYLQLSYNLGFPSEDIPEGLHLLARSTFEAGRPTASLPYWEKLLETQDIKPDVQRDCDEYMSQIYLLDPALDVDQGVQYFESLLARTDLTSDERTLALLDQATLLLRAERWDEGLERLEWIGDPRFRRARQLLLRGEMHLRKTMALDDRGELSEEERVKAYSFVIESLNDRNVNLSDDLDHSDEARYFQAICLDRLGEQEDAKQYFNEIRQDKPNEPIGWLAWIEEARLENELGDLGKTAEELEALLTTMAKGQTTDPLMLSYTEMSKKIVPMLQTLIDGQKFEEVKRISKLMWPPLPREDSLMWTAKAEESWGESLLDKAQLQSEAPDEVKPEELVKNKEQGLQHLRDAGLAYYKLAQLRRGSDYYYDDLENAADAYIRGKNFGEAVQIYENLLEEDIAERIATMHYKLGEAHLFQGRPDEALATLKKCIALRPKDPVTYKVRLLASQILLQLNNIEDAERLLEDNINQDALTPESVEWRDSLFQLGKVLFRDAAMLETQSKLEGLEGENAQNSDGGSDTLEKSHSRFQEAILRLNEAVQRYQGEVPTFEHRYLLAEAYRQSAKWPEKQAESVNVRTTKFQLQEQARDFYQKSHDVFDALVEDLSREQDLRKLSEVESKILRNTYFARADMLYDLEEYPAAIDAYSSAANQYDAKPESLEAFVRMASCYRKMNLPSDARGALEQAKLFLNDRIPMDADYENTTRYSRNEWLVYLNVLLKL